MNNWKSLYLLLAIGIISCGDKTQSENSANETNATGPAKFSYQLIGTLPHDTQSFTEGLFVHNGKIFESTGSPEELAFAQSHFGTLDTTSGSINVLASLDRNKYFGEGITIVGNKLFQLTYKAQTCFVYDATSFKQIGSFKYPNAEGWGLSTDGKHVIMSDGTFKISFLNPDDFSKIKEINVTENGYAVEHINELEYVNGFIYANLWTTNQILKIDANTGQVVAKADFGQLFLDAQTQNPNILEMNGIAYDASKDEFLITGKLWPKIYRLKFN